MFKYSRPKTFFVDLMVFSNYSPQATVRTDNLYFITTELRAPLFAVSSGVIILSPISLCFSMLQLLRLIPNTQ